MKNLSQYIQEKLIIKKNRNAINYNYFPKTKEELQDLIDERIEQEGNEVDLNDIDVSEITDLSGLFTNSDFNGDISKWDVSNVTDTHCMFYNCRKFNVGISNWDVSKVTNMYGMFYKCTSFNQDLSSWNVSKVTSMYGMFMGCPIEDKYKPKFK